MTVDLILINHLHKALQNFVIRFSHHQTITHYLSLSNQLHKTFS